MAEFDLIKFRSTEKERRTKDVPVPELAYFYPKSKKKETPVWTIQNMTGEELYKMRESVERNRDIEKTLAALGSGDNAEVAKSALGVSNNVPEDLARRLSVLVSGTVQKDFSRADAVSLAKAHPLTFDRLTNEIMILSGVGARPGEKNGSGTTPQ